MGMLILVLYILIGISPHCQSRFHSAWLKLEDCCAHSATSNNSSIMQRLHQSTRTKRASQLLGIPLYCKALKTFKPLQSSLEATAVPRRRLSQFLLLQCQWAHLQQECLTSTRSRY